MGIAGLSLLLSLKNLNWRSKPLARHPTAGLLIHLHEPVSDTSLKEVVDKPKPIIAKLKNNTLTKTARGGATEEYEDLVSQYNALSKDLKHAKDVTNEVLAILNKDAPKTEEKTKPEAPKNNPA